MTRPAVRMCTYCERSTSRPILIPAPTPPLALTPTGESPTPAGPRLGIYIYACQDCVTHHPALQDAIELLESPHHRSRMTLHIYKVNAKGAVAEDRGKVEIVTGYPTEPAPHISAYHPAPARDAADAIAKH